MLIERHVFGSHDGYRTLAHSPGLSATECKALEAFSFGTPYDPAVRESFAREPAYWSRPLGRDRRALTRGMQGERDDAGRPTMIFVTAVLSCDDWDDILQRDARPLLRIQALWHWGGSPRISAVTAPSAPPSALRLSGESLSRVMGILSHLERAWVTRRPVVLREENCTLDELLAVERLLPPTARQTYGAVHRSLNGDLGASLNCLARTIPAGAGNPARDPICPLTPYPRQLVEALASGRNPDSFIESYPNFASPIVDSSADFSEDEELSTTVHARHGEPFAAAGRRISVSAVVILTGLALIAGSAVGWAAHGLAPAPNPWPAIAEQAIAMPLVPGESQVQHCEELTKRLSSCDASDPARDRFERAMSQRSKTVQQARDADAAIHRIQTKDLFGQSDARTAIDALKTDAPETFDYLGARLEERKKTLADPLGTIVAGIVKDLTEANRGLAAESSPDACRGANDLIAAVPLLKKWNSSFNDAGINKEFDKLRTAARSKCPSAGTDDKKSSTADPELTESLHRLEKTLEGSKHPEKDPTPILEGLKLLSDHCDKLTGYREFKPCIYRLHSWIEVENRETNRQIDALQMDLNTQKKQLETAQQMGVFKDDPDLGAKLQAVYSEYRTYQVLVDSRAKTSEKNEQRKRARDAVNKLDAEMSRKLSAP